MMLGSVRHPEVLSHHLVGTKAEFSLKIPSNLAYLEGHFPGFPIVPGVVQLHWAVEFAKEIFGIDGTISHSSKIKFSNVICPSDKVYMLTLDHNPEKNSYFYRYESDEKAYSSGIIHYLPVPTEGNL